MDHTGGRRARAQRGLYVPFGARRKVAQRTSFDRGRRRAPDPAVLGQGMCAGMRDVANLGWKLIGVLREEFTDELLDSYQTERFPHVREYIELAVKLGGIINTRAADVALPNTSKTAGDTLQLRVDN